MPAEVAFRTFRLSDRELLAAFDQVRNECEPGQDLRLRLEFGERIQPIEVALSDIGKHELVQRVLASEASLFFQVTMNPSRSKGAVQVRRGDTSDNVRVTFPDNVEGAVTVPLLAACRRYFKAYERTESLDRLLGDELAEFYRKREQTIVRLEELTESLVRENVAYRQKAEEEFVALRQRLDAQMDSERERLRAEHQEKEAALRAREVALEESAKALDDRSSRHARRQLRQDLKEILASRGKDFSLTKKTAAKRVPIHVLFWLLVATPGVVFVRSLYEVIAFGISPSWFHLWRLPVSGVALAGALIFYIRWNDQWFRQHAEEEFRLKRLDLDIDRASWIVEMALEWKEEKGTELPRELVEPLTRNLFVAHEARGDRVRHPGEDLASALLGASTQLNVQVPGVGEAKLDRRGLKRFQESTKESNPIS